MYTGREYDRGLKLYYNRARYYNPQLARFISRDPIDIADDVNLYSYVGNNSIGFVDRNGLEGKPVLNTEKYKSDFIKAYDEYLGLEEDYNAKEDFLYDALYNPFYYGSYEYLKQDRTEAYDALIEQEKYVKELHYKRNDYNVDASGHIGWVNENNRKEMPLYLSWYHQQTTNILKPNSKFVSEDGHFETIYNSEGFIENDIKDIGTYNIYPPSNKEKHWKYDVEPYHRWGNGINDDTTIFERKTGF